MPATRRLRVQEPMVRRGGARIKTKVMMSSVHAFVCMRAIVMLMLMARKRKECEGEGKAG